MEQEMTHYSQTDKPDTTFGGWRIFRKKHYRQGMYIPFETNRGVEPTKSLRVGVMLQVSKYLGSWFS